MQYELYFQIQLLPPLANCFLEQLLLRVSELIIIVILLVFVSKMRVVFIGVGQLHNETNTLKALELDDDSTLFLEFNQHHSDDPSQICFRYCFVTGNDRSVKINLDQIGHRSEEFSSLTHCDDTVTQFREKLMLKHNINITLETRLRLTNWAGESADVLGEFNEETVSITIKSLIEKSVIKSGDLILIGNNGLNSIWNLKLILFITEEGVAPIPGFLQLKVNQEHFMSEYSLLINSFRYIFGVLKLCTLKIKTL